MVISINTSGYGTSEAMPSCGEKSKRKEETWIYNSAFPSEITYLSTSKPHEPGVTW